jgi:hypothetical protein
MLAVFNTLDAEAPMVGDILMEVTIRQGCFPLSRSTVYNDDTRIFKLTGYLGKPIVATHVKIGKNMVVGC